MNMIEFINLYINAVEEAKTLIEQTLESTPPQTEPLD